MPKYGHLAYFALQLKYQKSFSTPSSITYKTVKIMKTASPFICKYTGMQGAEECVPMIHVDQQLKRMIQ